MTLTTAAVLTALGPGSALAAPPPNDDFADAETISTFPATLSGTTLEATHEAGEPNHAGQGPGTGPSVWWRWTPSDTRHVTLSGCVTTTTNNWDVIAVYTGDDVTSLEEVASAYTGAACTSLSFWTEPDVEYSIAIVKNGLGPDPAMMGPFSVSLDSFTGRDDFAFAFELPNWVLPYTDLTSNVGATKEPGEPDHADEPGGASIWWRWTAQNTGTITFHTCDSTFDTVLAVYLGEAIDDLVEVDSNDDAPNDLCGTGSGVAFRAQAGETYSIAVDGFEGDTGNVTLHLEPPPPNDDLANAALLPGTGGHLEASSAFAGWEPDEPLHAGLPGVHSVWWRWTAPANGTATLKTCGSDFDTVLSVYTGTSVGQLTEVASNNDACGTQSSVTFAARAGTEYRVAVDGTGPGVMGPIVLDFKFDVPQPPPPPPPPPPPITNVATSGNDLLTGTDGPNLICGLGGSDTIRGMAGLDSLFGDECPGTPASSVVAGNDQLFGGPGNDSLYGSRGRDRLEGGTGRDRLDGGKGRDVLKGGPGNDALITKDGQRDLVDCGTGRDAVMADRRDQLRGCEQVRRR